MSSSVLWEALSPLAARLPKVVREHEILRIAATISGNSQPNAANIARQQVLVWTQNRSGGRLPDSAWRFQGFEYFSGGRNSMGVRIENETSDIWAIRADDPDKEVPGRIWTTEVVVGAMAGQAPRFSSRLLVSTTEDELDIEPHVPGLVRQIAEKCGLSRGIYEINPHPLIVKTNDQADGLVESLVDSDRRLPVFVLTIPEAGDGPLLDADVLARAVLGIGHVVVLPAPFTWALTQRFGKPRSVFGGAVRAYLPGFSEDANPYAHRLVLAEQLSTGDGQVQCSRWMRSLAAKESVRRTALGVDVLAFAAIRNVSLEIADGEREILHHQPARGARHPHRFQHCLQALALEDEIGRRLRHVRRA